VAPPWNLGKLTNWGPQGGFNPRALIVSGLTLIVISAVMCIWQFAHGQPAGASQAGTFTGGLLGLCAGLYLDNRRLRRGGTH
jgi:hypothetical protein